MTRYRWIPTGASLTGVSGTLVKSDELICQEFVSDVDDKRFMNERHDREVSTHVLESVQNVRVYAVNAQHAPASKQASQAIREVARACRDYVSSAKRDADSQTLDIALYSLRKRIGTQLLALCERFDLEIDLDLTPYVESGVEVLEKWFRDDEWDVAAR